MYMLHRQLIRDDLRASTGAEGSEWWRGGGDEGEGRGEDKQEEAHMDSLEDYVELLYEGKDKVRGTNFLEGKFLCVTTDQPSSALPHRYKEKQSYQ